MLGAMLLPPLRLMDAAGAGSRLVRSRQEDGGSQSNAIMVCLFLRLPFQASCRSLPARPQRGEAAPKRVFCFGPRVLTSMCVALADHTEMGCTA